MWADCILKIKVGSLPFQNRREELREPQIGVVHDRQTGELQQLKNFGNFWRKPKGIITKPLIKQGLISEQGFNP